PRITENPVFSHCKVIQMAVYRESEWLMAQIHGKTRFQPPDSVIWIVKAKINTPILKFRRVYVPIVYL
ncbi:MAG: hypothetical protein MJ153_09280, partial [Clostridia bacterium]|nr:hypothetical protein [Clostridia bacterium]